MSKKLDIITIPHPTLRQKAAPISQVDKKMIQFVSDLLTTLDLKRRPAGVGLAAPQVDKLWRIFTTKLTAEGRGDDPVLRAFINPVITTTSNSQSLGEQADDPDLEGCLSIPLLYGPVPRWEWVDLEYQVIEGDQLVDQHQRFYGFPARVVQHEVDHLDGILFTDHVFEYGLPLYRQNEHKKFEEIDPALLEGI